MSKAMLGQIGLRDGPCIDTGTVLVEVVPHVLVATPAFGTIWVAIRAAGNWTEHPGTTLPRS